MNQKKSVMSPDDEDDDKADLRRRRILDATLACYVAYGWSGTNMSVIARHVRLTRGMIQYYFPTIDAIHHATVAHLNGEWRKKYFSYIELGSGSAVRLEDRLEIRDRRDREAHAMQRADGRIPALEFRVLTRQRPGESIDPAEGVEGEDGGKGDDDTHDEDRVP